MVKLPDEPCQIRVSFLRANDVPNTFLPSTVLSRVDVYKRQVECSKIIIGCFYDFCLLAVKFLEENNMWIYNLYKVMSGYTAI